MAAHSAQSGREQPKPAAGYPPRDFKFLALNLAVKLMPTGWKFWDNSILLTTFIGDSRPIIVPEPYTWTWAGSEEIDLMNRHPEATSPTAYPRRAARGDRCLCIKHGSDVVSYWWVTLCAGCVLCGFGPKTEIALFPLKPGQVFTYDLYTYRKYRGRGVATMVNKLLYHALREEGIQEVLTIVSTDNHASLRLQLRLGAQPERLVYNYRIRSWNRSFFGPERDTRLIEWVQQFKSNSALVSKT